MARCMACLEQVEEVETLRLNVGNKTYLYQVCESCRRAVTKEEIKLKLSRGEDDAG